MSRLKTTFCDSLVKIESTSGALQNQPNSVEDRSVASSSIANLSFRSTPARRTSQRISKTGSTMLTNLFTSFRHLSSPSFALSSLKETCLSRVSRSRVAQKASSGSSLNPVRLKFSAPRRVIGASQGLQQIERSSTHQASGFQACSAGWKGLAVDNFLGPRSPLVDKAK